MKQGGKEWKRHKVRNGHLHCIYGNIFVVREDCKAVSITLIGDKHGA